MVSSIFLKNKMAAKISGVLIDLSGTIHVENTVMPGAIQALKRLRKTGVSVRFVTNTTKESKDTLLNRLNGLGFDIKSEEVFTSLTAARQVVKKRNLRPLLFLGSDASKDFHGIDVNNPNAVVVGLAPDCFSYEIAVELVGEENCPTKVTQKFLEEEFASSKLTRIIILDEMDQLESKSQEILYTIFEWPSLPKSKLVLIGIANALDLTDRILPRLQARPKCKPELLHFAPYTRDQIVKIIQDRLTVVEEGSSILDTSAIQFCARKVSAMAGDMRKALDICRRAVEVVESGERKQQILQPVHTAESPRKRPETPPKPKKVGISQIASVVAEVYGSRLVAGPGIEQPTIPLQQKLLICTFLLMTKDRNTKEVVLGKFHDTYCKICTRRKVSQLGQEDFLGLCNILETRGLLGIKRAKDTRMMKVTLKIDEKEVDYALQDKTLLSSILQEGMPTTS
ncbi:unnamed protein product [Porites evermanni]|uniref:STAS domain-containing protein n=1 Tax=Porites evermanni TaxID=104178 RepID=A0ABN8M420_9CNID|nr:unnamed protein product [Porites evermanni]